MITPRGNLPGSRPGWRPRPSGHPQHRRLPSPFGIQRSEVSSQSGDVDVADKDKAMGYSSRPGCDSVSPSRARPMRAGIFDIRRSAVRTSPRGANVVPGGTTAPGDESSSPLCVKHNSMLKIVNTEQESASGVRELWVAAPRCEGRQARSSSPASQRAGHAVI
jgi:hypothetical protein